ncbi:aryl-sulfate sulfotransferase [Christiangramia sp. ASW11-125]|uniref:aryl-sulfate sulfotransferase n=1 Tax=Christiangramia sp. ASW11-125 TaxID=3400701 RepID=UPI003AB0093A
MKKIYYILFFALLISCSEDDSFEDTSDQEVIEEVVDSTEVELNLAGEITYHDLSKAEQGLILVNDAAANRIYLMEKIESIVLKEWELPAGIGNDGELMEDGSLLVALTDPGPAYNFGGYGGRVAIISPENEIIWDYEYSDSINLSHHDVEMLPNGNVLILAWEKRTKDQLALKGYGGPYENVYVEKLLEVDRSNNQTVWEWNVWDHLVQDGDPDAQDFGVIADNPERVNINYEDTLKDANYNGDIFHANAIEYDEKYDLIYMSVNHFSEVWVIDHSTTLEQAKGNIGGSYNKGGDLVFRFGNPGAYNNVGDRMFFHNHHPNLVAGSNSMLVFSNGLLNADPHSTVYEVELPEVFDLQRQTNNELNVLWSYSHPDLFSPKVSGAQRLENGNTLITEGDSGYWEVSEDGEVVWRFESEGFFWRGYHYDQNSPQILGLNLE